MSIHVISQVFKHSRSQGTARVVLLALAQYADDKGQCWPGFGSLAKDANVDRSTIIRSIKKLIDLGEIEKIGTGPSGSNRYQITVTSGTDATSSTGATSGTDATGGGSTDATRGSGTGATLTVIEPSNNRQDIERAKPKQSKGTRLETDWQPDERCREWARGKGYDERQIEQLGEQFRLHFTSPDCKQPLKRDWYRAWQKWIANDLKWHGPPDRQRSQGRRAGAGSIVTAVGDAVDQGADARGIPRLRF